jgi:hypothetical protein
MLGNILAALKGLKITHSVQQRRPALQGRKIQLPALLDPSVEIFLFNEGGHLDPPRFV